MRRPAWILIGLALVLGGCRKKHSPEFPMTKATFSGLVDRQGDDAYAAPEMEQVITSLKGVTDAQLEFEEAAALLQRIDSERARIKKEAEERERAKAAAAPDVAAVAPQFDDPKTRPPMETDVPPPAAPPDAGPPVEDKIEAGMAESDFQRKFSACFESPRPVSLPTGGAPVQAYKVKDRSECTRKYGGAEVSYFFTAGKFTGQFTEVTRKDPAPAPPEKKAAPPPTRTEVVYPKPPESISIP